MLFLLASVWLIAAPANCPTAPNSGASLPVEIGLAGRPGVPSGVNGNAYLDLPMEPHVSCPGAPPSPSDVLRGQPDDLLNPHP
jgi:hypothetical protein